MVTISTSPTSPLGEALAEAREVRVEAAVEADHQRRAGALDDGKAALDARAREIDRLFAEDRLAGPGGALDQVGVGGGRRTDQDRADVAPLDHVLERRHLRPRRLRQRLSGRGVRVGDGDETRGRMGRRVASVNATDPACAQHGDSDHHALPRRGTFGIDVPMWHGK